MKRFFAIGLMALVVGLGTPATFADGTAESPGIRSTTTAEIGGSGGSITAEGTAESPGIKGVAESPGIMTMISIYLDVII
jgi:hypothetical protein